MRTLHVASGVAALFVFVNCGDSGSSPPKKSTGAGGDDGTGHGAGPSASTGTHSTGTGTGGSASTGTPPSACLVATNCVGSEDCPNGYHCNAGVSPPQCEKLYCGVESTACSEDAHCVVGLKCTGEICGPPKLGSSCNTNADCPSSAPFCVI